MDQLVVALDVNSADDARSLAVAFARFKTPRQQSNDKTSISM